MRICLLNLSKLTLYAGQMKIDTQALTATDPWAILVGTGLGAVPGRRLALGLPGAFRFFRGRLSGPSHLLALWGFGAAFSQ